MSAFDHSVLTNVGWDQLSAALAGGNLTFLQMEAGDGTVTGDPEMETMTALKNKIMDIPITSYSDDGEGQLTLIGTLSSKNVDTPFYFRELGVKALVGPSTLALAQFAVSGETPTPEAMALKGPTGEQLYCVANSYDSADYIPDKTNAATVIQNVEIVVKIDKATDVTITVIQGDVTAQNIGPTTVGAGWFRDKLASILYFKRFISTSTVRVTETTDTIKSDVIFPQFVPTGCMMDWPTEVPPANWLLCWGQPVNRNTYPNLYNLLGTRYGAGDGSTTFNLPDFRGRVALGAGSGPGLTNRFVSDKGGTETVVLTEGQMPYHTHSASQPAHTHGVYDPTHAHGVYDPTHAHSIADPTHGHSCFYEMHYGAPAGVQGGAGYNWTAGWQECIARGTGIGIYASGVGIGIYGAYTGVSIYAAGADYITVGYTGGNQAHANMPPYLVINKIIKT